MIIMYCFTKCHSSYILVYTFELPLDQLPIFAIHQYKNWKLSMQKDLLHSLSVRKLGLTDHQPIFFRLLQPKYPEQHSSKTVYVLRDRERRGDARQGTLNQHHQNESPLLFFLVFSTFQLNFLRITLFLTSIKSTYSEHCSSRPVITLRARNAGTPAQARPIAIKVRSRISKWVDIHEMHNITADSTIEVFRDYFSTWGIPVKVVRAI